MSQRLIASALFLPCFGWFAASFVHGQVGRRASVDRPSSSSPSRVLGFVGGVYTRQLSVSAAGGDVGPETGPRGLPRPGYFGAAGGFGRLPPAPMPQALTFAQVGYTPGRAPAPMFDSMGAVPSVQLARVSRLQASQSLTTPLGGRGPYHLRFPDRPYYALAPQGGAVHEFFGLTPTPAADASQTPVPIDGLVGLLEQENQRLVLELRSRALSSFRRAMNEDLPDRGELLSTAQRQLNTVRDLENRVSIPCLLLVHTALEKGQILQAVRHLAEAVRRQPSVFVDRPDIASYYGDAEWLADQQRSRSQLLEGQMRKYLRIGDENPGEPGAYVLQAYCAWMLNDRMRVKHTLDRMMAAEQEATVGAEIIAVRHALAVAIK